MGKLSEPGDVLARVVAAKLALEDGATDYAWTLLHELELDLAAWQDAE